MAGTEALAELTGAIKKCKVSLEIDKFYVFWYFQKDIGGVMSNRISSVVRRFFGKFDDVPIEKLVEKLGISARTLKRLRDGDNQASADTLAKMTAMVESANDEALGTMAERLARAEYLRATHEKEQRDVRLASYQDGLLKKYPHWFIRVRENLLAGRNQLALESLVDQIEDPNSWSGIDSDIKPYVLHAQGVAYYRTGANFEALQASSRAIKESRKSNSVSTLLRAWVLVIHGLSSTRLFDSDAAFASFEEARKIDPSVDGSYYNAMCCASIIKSEDQLGYWCGQYAASSHLFSPEDIEDVISRIPEDKDLVFFRELPIMKEFVGRLREELQSRPRKKET